MTVRRNTYLYSNIFFWGGALNLSLGAPKPLCTPYRNWNPQPLASVDVPPISANSAATPAPQRFGVWSAGSIRTHQRTSYWSAHTFWACASVRSSTSLPRRATSANATWWRTRPPATRSIRAVGVAWKESSLKYYLTWLKISGDPFLSKIMATWLDACSNITSYKQHEVSAYSNGYSCQLAVWHSR